MKPSHIFAMICMSIFILGSCQTVKDVKLIYNKKVSPSYVEMRGKRIILTPIAHLGQKEFFSALTDSVKNWKGQGYTVFYEEITIGPHEIEKIPMAEYETILRKFRKILGGSPTREHYGEVGETFEGAITQPSYAELGLDSLDINADVTFKEFVDEYERLYGPQALSECDLNTHLDSAFTCQPPLKNDIDPVKVDFRNKELVKKLVAAEQKKIVVLFGAYHIKEVEKMLKRYK